MLSEKDVLKWARFVATKFVLPDGGWKYSRDLGGLKHIRYKDDYTGYNHWFRRLKRTFGAWNPFAYFFPKDGTVEAILKPANPTLWGFLLEAWAMSQVYLQKETNLPDGQVNGNITFWEEDGQYIMLFGPSVGNKVLDFIEAEPNNPHAIAIVEEMVNVARNSYPDISEEED